MMSPNTTGLRDRVFVELAPWLLSRGSTYLDIDSLCIG